MSDNKFDISLYQYDNVFSDTYYAIYDVQRNLDRFAEDTHTIDLNFNPEDARR